MQSDSLRIASSVPYCDRLLLLDSRTVAVSSPVEDTQHINSYIVNLRSVDTAWTLPTDVDQPDLLAMRPIIFPDGSGGGAGDRRNDEGVRIRQELDELPGYHRNVDNRSSSVRAFSCFLTFL